MVSDTIHANLLELVIAVSKVIDLLSPDINDHHARVAYGAYAIAKEMRLEGGAVTDLLLAALLHDIGIISIEAHAEVIKYDSADVSAHAYKGWSLLKGFCHLRNAAEIILHHHVPWSQSVGLNENGAINDFSHAQVATHILHFVDRLDVSIGRTTSEVLSNKKQIVEAMMQDSGTRFSPDVMLAFKKLSQRDSFWLDMMSPDYDQLLTYGTNSYAIELDGNDMLVFSEIMAQIIDFRCSYTAAHSYAVAKIGERLAELSGLTKSYCKQIRLAGYLHDIGKLAIPREIIEKNGDLTSSEYSVMRTHVYHTRKILCRISGFEEIVKWASQHHERLNGSGYPDCVTEKDIPLGSRIIAVADVLTALLEDRPYRSKLTRDEITTVMTEMADKRVLEPELIHIALENYSDMEMQMEHARSEVGDNYKEFGCAISDEREKERCDHCMFYDTCTELA